jgi:dienelactone hydrolase
VPKALHLTAIPLRSIPAGELGRYKKRLNGGIMCVKIFSFTGRGFSSGNEFRIHFSFLLLLTFILVHGCAGNGPLVKYNVDGTTSQALIFKPEGPGPFPTVIYNHGMVVDLHGLSGAYAHGYQLERMCKALADSGYLVVAPIRQSGRGNLPEHKREVDRAIDYVRKLPEVDPSRIGLMGFSRGGLLTLMASVERSDLKAIVILAPAPGEGLFAKTVRRASSLNAPVLLLVEASDGPGILENFEALSKALQELGKESRSIKYDRGGGHKLFYSVGYYWDDVRRFLKDNL